VGGISTGRLRCWQSAALRRRARSGRRRPSSGSDSKPPGFFSAYVLDALFAPIPVSKMHAERPMTMASRLPPDGSEKPARIPSDQSPSGRAEWASPADARGMQEAVSACSLGTR
jgi:hypothetical protein